MNKFFVQEALGKSGHAQCLSEVEFWQVSAECPSAEEAWRFAGSYIAGAQREYGLRIVELNMSTLEINVLGYICKAYFLTQF